MHPDTVVRFSAYASSRANLQATLDPGAVSPNDSQGADKESLYGGDDVELETTDMQRICECLHDLHTC